MSDKLKDAVDQYFDKHIFIPTRTIKLYSDVDDDFLNILETGIEVFNQSKGDITIKLSSDGGSVAVARAAYDTIKESPNDVYIKCYGEVSSAATIVLQAADYRICMPNSKLMIHVGSESIGQEHPRNVDSMYEEHRKDEEWMEGIYHKRIKEKKKRFTRQQLKAMLRFDKYLSPKESLDLGLIDEIMELS